MYTAVTERAFTFRSHKKRFNCFKARAVALNVAELDAEVPT